MTTIRRYVLGFALAAACGAFALPASAREEAATPAGEPAWRDFNLHPEGLVVNWFAAGPFDRPVAALEAEAARGAFPVPSAETDAAPAIPAPAGDGTPAVWRWHNARDGIAWPGADAAVPEGGGARHYYLVARLGGADEPQGALIVNADVPARLWAAGAAPRESRLDARARAHGLVAPVAWRDDMPAVWVRLDVPAGAAAEAGRMLAAAQRIVPPDPARPGDRGSLAAVEGLCGRLPDVPFVRRASAGDYAAAVKAAAAPGFVRPGGTAGLIVHVDPAGLPASAPTLADGESDLPPADGAPAEGVAMALAGWPPRWEARLDYAVPDPLPDGLARTGAGRLRASLSVDGNLIVPVEARVVDKPRADACIARADVSLRTAREADLVRRYGLDAAKPEVPLGALATLDLGVRAQDAATDRIADVRLSVEQHGLAHARGGLYARPPSAARYADWIDRIGRAEAPPAGDDLDAPRRQGALGEGAYISAIDGSVQPFRYVLPERLAADRGRPLPLIVMLHGYVPDYTKESWVDMDAATARAMDELGAAILWPFGRGNTDFLTIGEEDVLQAIEALARRHPVDRRRIFLAGYSMGGSGVWTLLAHYPDRWAGALIWSGRNDWFYWQSDRLARSGLNRDNFPAFKKFLVLMDNPYDMPGNMAGIPIHAVHPRDDDMVKPGQATRMHALLRPPHGRMTIAQPDAGGHFLFARQIDHASTWRPMLANVLPDDPDAVDFTTYTPKYGRMHGVEIQAIDRWGEPARVKMRRVAEGDTTTFHLDAVENVRTLLLRLPGMEEEARAFNVSLASQGASPVDGPDPEDAYAFRVRGKGGGERTFRIRFADPARAEDFDAPQIVTTLLSPPDKPGELRLALALHRKHRRRLSQRGAAFWMKDDAARSTPWPAKTSVRGGRAGACFGPVREAFNGRFVLVLGTGGTEAEQAANRRNLEHFRKDWQVFAHAELPAVTDTEWLAFAEHRRRLSTEWQKEWRDGGRDAVPPVLMEWNKALSANLVCFGRPANHAYLAGVAEALPFRFLDDGYGVGEPATPAWPRPDAFGAVREPREVRGGGLGFVGIYPRPDWPMENGAYGTGWVVPSVVVIDGIYYGERQSFNHKWDLAPDYIVFGPEQLPYDGNNAPRLAGFFDSDWRFDPGLAWTFGPPAPPAVAPGGGLDDGGDG